MARLAVLSGVLFLALAIGHSAVITNKNAPKNFSEAYGTWRNVFSGKKESFSTFLGRMWDLDSNGTNADQLVLNIQGDTGSDSYDDEAPEKLFTFVNESVLFTQPTVMAFVKLLDNYVHESGVAETYTQQEKEEISDFLDAICDTKIMEETRKFLVANGKPFETMAKFKAYLEEVWFTLYPRSQDYNKPIDSSAFEHVFLGDVKKSQKKISGLHNWIQAYLLEKGGQLDYKGYVYEYIDLNLGRVIMGARLQAYGPFWKKPFSSFIFGSSLEFDLAAYTSCFALTPNKQCSFKVQDKTVRIQTMRFMSKNHISTAYPVV